MKGNAANIYVWLFVLYSLAIGVFDEGFIISRILSNILRIWSLICAFKIFLLQEKKPLYLKALSVLLVMFIIYGLIQHHQGQVYILKSDLRVTGVQYIGKISNSLLPIFAFYYYSRKGLITESLMNKRVLIFLVVITIGAYYNMLMSMRMRGDDEVTNNFGYTFLSIIPMMLFVKNSKKQFFLIAYCLLMILLCMKRGPLFIAVLLMLLYSFYYFRISPPQLKGRIFFYVIIACLVGVIAVSLIFSNNIYFQERINDTMEGGSSGRDIYYAFFFDYYMNNTSQKDFLLGMGANATLSIWDNFAHNDWLEIAINQGVLGLCVYLFYWIAFIKLCCRKMLRPEIKFTLWMLFLIYFLQTLFSMSYKEYNLYSSIVLGYCISVSYFKKKVVYEKDIA